MIGANYSPLIVSVLAEAWREIGPWTADQYPDVARHVRRRVQELLGKDAPMADVVPFQVRTFGDE